ncbi:MAG TPA: hypothetical protein VGM41_16485 [Chitinophagaceae bacterium]|jgi:hypothetical protein
MKKLFVKLLVLAGILILAILVSFVLPPDSTTKNYMLFAQGDKNDLLKNTPGPRVIFIGGSNLSFGLNCQLIKDSFRLNPVNTALHAGLGLKYMLLNSIRYVREKDIVVIAPEYQQFYGNLYNGDVELLKMITDVAAKDSSVKRGIDFDQCLALAQCLPEYASSKLKLWNYLKKTDTTVIGIYDRRSFDAYGDAYIHWKLPRQTVQPFEPIKGRLNEGVIDLLVSFREMLQKKGATLYITFPGCQDISFDHSVLQIHAVEEKLKEHGFDLLGTPERYRMPDSLVFNTPYHLVKKGVDYRTALLVEDLKKVIGRDARY